MADDKAILTQLSDKVIRMIPSDSVSNTATPQFSEFIEKLSKSGVSDDERKAIIRAYNYFNTLIGIPGIVPIESSDKPVDKPVDKPLDKSLDKQGDSRVRDSQVRVRDSQLRVRDSNDTNDSLELPIPEIDTTPDEEMTQLLLDLVSLDESKA